MRHTAQQIEFYSNMEQHSCNLEVEADELAEEMSVCVGEIESVWAEWKNERQGKDTNDFEIRYFFSSSWYRETLYCVDHEKTAPYRRR